MADHYTTLGVSRTATADEITKAYKKLARVHHPDANPGDPGAEERFKEIGQAHDVLSDPEKRRHYDMQLRFGGARTTGNGGGAGGGAGGDAGMGGFGDFADILGSIFRNRGAGGGRGPQGEPESSRGGDVEVEVNLSFEQAMAGAQVPVSVETPVACPTCGGSGAKPGTSPRLCPECKGRGVRGRDVGSFAFSEPCPRCGGGGTVVDDPCPTCDGRGATANRQRIQVKIPAGVKDGTRIRLKGKGQPGRRGGPAGDLQVVTRVAPSSRYERQGDDLVIQVPVTMSEAALGAQVEVPTLDGRVKLTVPAGSADGRKMRVPGKGAPRLKGGGHGDLIAQLHVVVPKELTKRQREALQRFAKDEADPREALFS